eukprot:TRINITY_DN564_c5_g1_i1.p2 TRINITY_DN564_c5_g1~~TRINITY_DN564_c5_g1_i1.p2  ORF type:complete len:138 (+),score=0.58 TRINITY_DN564_c5_g1_i1:130-543(+)
MNRNSIQSKLCCNMNTTTIFLLSSLRDTQLTFAAFYFKKFQETLIRNQEKIKQFPIFIPKLFVHVFRGYQGALPSIKFLQPNPLISIPKQSPNFSLQPTFSLEMFELFPQLEQIPFFNSLFSVGQLFRNCNHKLLHS